MASTPLMDALPRDRFSQSQETSFSLLLWERSNDVKRLSYFFPQRYKSIILKILITSFITTTIEKSF